MKQPIKKKEFNHFKRTNRKTIKLYKKNNNNKYSIRMEKREEDINNISNISVLQIKKRS